MEIQRYLSVVFRWLWLILAGTILAGVGSYFLSRNLEPIYQASTTILIRQSGNPVSPIESNRIITSTYASLLAKRSVLQEVITQLGLPYPPPTLRAMVSVTTSMNDPLLYLRVENPDPELAQGIANAIAQVFIRQQRQSLEGRSQQSLGAVETQLESLTRRLAALQANPNPTGTEQTEVGLLRNEMEQLRTLRTLWNLQAVQAVAAESITIEETAALPTRPVRPNLVQNVLLAAILGLVVTTGGAFLIEYLDRSVKSVEDVTRATGLSVLGVILRFKTGGDVKGGLIALAHPRSSVAEAFRMVRTNLQFATLDKPGQRFLVTSASPGEGKTLISSNLAVSIAQAGKRVILIDADLRRPQVHKLFGLENSQGFTNLLLDERANPLSYLQDGQVTGLRVLTAGSIPPNPAELLASPRVGHLLETLRNEADILIVDGSPILLVADPGIMAAKLDGVILVAQSGRTTPEDLLASKEALTAANISIVGVVLNRVEPAGRGGYYYYHRYPYRYYHYYHDEEGKQERRQGVGHLIDKVRHELSRPLQALRR